MNDTGHLLGVSMKSGKLVYSDDPDIQVGDIISNSAAIAFDNRLEQVVAAHPYSWFKVKKVQNPGPRAHFYFVCPVCKKIMRFDSMQEQREIMTQHRKGRHNSP